MYNDFYGFSADPFNITPDHDFLFMSPKHKQALTCMEFGLMRDIGLMLITGEIGIGKTTLIYYLLDQLDQFEKRVKVAYLFNTNVSPDQLLALILQELGADIQTDNKAVALQALQKHLKKIRSKGFHPLIIIDDAHNLSFDALEEVRLLSNLQSGKTPLLQIMLVGQSELQMKIASPALASFSQRIGVRYHLRPLTRQETIEYISHRIRTVAGNPDLFTKKAINHIFATAGGIPRAINLLCDHSLVYGFVDELNTIDEVTVKKVIEDFNVHPLAHPTSSKDQSQSHAAGASPSMQPTSGSENASFHDQENLEARLASIERLVNSYFKELHSQFKSQLINERLRSDKLLMAYTRLKLKVHILKGRGDSSDDNAKEQTKKSQNAETKTSKPVRIASKLKAIQNQ